MGFLFSTMSHLSITGRFKGVFSRSDPVASGDRSSHAWKLVQASIVTQYGLFLYKQKSVSKAKEYRVKEIRGHMTNS